MKRTKKNKGQIALEFILLVSFGFVSLIIFLVIVNNVLSTKIEEKSTIDIENFGESIRNEFVLASELENGYHRMLNIPYTINGKEFSFEFGKSISGVDYFILKTEKTELFYQIPEVKGNLTYGYNTLVKDNNTIVVVEGITYAKAVTIQ